MAEDSPIGLVLLAGAGYLAWKWWQGRTPAPATSAANISWADPLPLTAAHATVQQATQRPVYQQQSQSVVQPQIQPQQAPQQSSSFFSFLASHPATDVPTFTGSRGTGTPGVFNPAWNAGMTVQQSGGYDAAALAALDAAASKTSGVMQSTYTGASDPNAPAPPVLDPASFWYLQHCTYITGAPIQPPPPGCS